MTGNNSPCYNYVTLTTWRNKMDRLLRNSESITVRRSIKSANLSAPIIHTDITLDIAIKNDWLSSDNGTVMVSIRTAAGDNVYCDKIGKYRVQGEF